MTMNDETEVKEPTTTALCIKCGEPGARDNMDCLIPDRVWCHKDCLELHDMHQEAHEAEKRGEKLVSVGELVTQLRKRGLLDKTKPLEPARREVANSPFGCAWRGCQATTRGLPLPAGWHTLLFGDCDSCDSRHEALCPTHTRELNALLKPEADKRLLDAAQGHG
jgi:hypothetical protein